MFIFSSINGFKVYMTRICLDLILFFVESLKSTDLSIFGVTYFSIHSCNVSRKKTLDRKKGHVLARIKEKSRESVVTKKRVTKQSEGIH